MKLLNIILIANEGEGAGIDAVQQLTEITPQINVLESLAREVPGFAETPEYKELMATSQKLREELGEVVEQGDEGGADEGGADEGGADEGGADEGGADEGADKKKVEKQTDTGLEGLPFFGAKKGTALTDEELANLDDKSLPALAKKLNVDTTKKGWVGEIIKAYAPAKSGGDEFKTKYDQLVESINLMPKELQTAVNLFLEEKDWREAITTGATLDLSKPFDKLSDAEKVKVHNYYFPDDKITAENIEDKAVQKAIKAAEAKYGSDKFVYEQTLEKNSAKRKESIERFKSSADGSLAALKAEFPQFIDDEVKRIEEIIKVKGIQSLFIDDKGNVLPDAAKKLAFALNGENILKTAMKLAENRGKTKGKAEVLSTVEETKKGANSQGTKLTDEEKNLTKIVKDSSVFSNLTY